MNILCIDQFATWGGGQRSLFDLLPSFRERGWEPHVVLPGAGSFSEELGRQGYATYSLDSSDYTSIRKPFREMVNYLWELPKLRSKLESLVDQTQPALLYVNGPRFLPHAALVARRKSIPLVFHCHHRLAQRSAIQMVGASLWLPGAYVIGCCEHAVRPIESFVDPRHLSVVYNGVLSPNRTRARKPRPIKIIGVIGRIEREKGQHAFVEAARILAKSSTHHNFTIAGSPMFSNSNYYQEVLTASNGLPIRFVEWKDDVEQIFDELDLVVVPSTHLESTTRVILEAFAFGVPVVALPAGGIPEVVQDNYTGFLAADNTAEALAQRIQSVLDMPAETVESVVANAHRMWQNKFTLSRYRNEVCHILSQAIGEGTLSEPRDVSAVYTISAKTDQ